MTDVPLDLLVYRLMFGHSQERKRDIEPTYIEEKWNPSQEGGNFLSVNLAGP
jgi:hypothetical protein